MYLELESSLSPDLEFSRSCSQPKLFRHGRLLDCLEFPPSEQKIWLAAGSLNPDVNVIVVPCTDCEFLCFSYAIPAWSLLYRHLSLHRAYSRLVYSLTSSLSLVPSLALASTCVYSQNSFDSHGYRSTSCTSPP